jgi:hypothetical protein
MIDQCFKHRAVGSRWPARSRIAVTRASLPDRRPDGRSLQHCPAAVPTNTSSVTGPQNQHAVTAPPSRRQLLLQSAAGLALSLTQLPNPATALTLEDVTPATTPSGPLTAREVSVITIFEAATPAVVTVFDTTLIVS